jgi:branched-chain amino acid transport system permease protein
MAALISPQLAVAALILGSLYALVALGLNLIYGSMRLLNVAHGEIVMIGAFVTYSAVTLLDASPLAGLALAAAAAALLGAAGYLGLFRRVLANPLLSARIEANSLLLFFGLSVVLQNVAALIFTASPRAYPAFRQVVEFAGVSLTAGRLIALGIAGTACLAAIIVLRRSMLGLSLRALIQSREASAVVGVNIGRVQALAFAIGFGAAGLAGGLLSMLEQITPFMGFPSEASAEACSPACCSAWSRPMAWRCCRRTGARS